MKNEFEFKNVGECVECFHKKALQVSSINGYVRGLMFELDRRGFLKGGLKDADIKSD